MRGELVTNFLDFLDFLDRRELDAQFTAEALKTGKENMRTFAGMRRRTHTMTMIVKNAEEHISRNLVRRYLSSANSKRAISFDVRARSSVNEPVVVVDHRSQYRRSRRSGSLLSEEVMSVRRTIARNGPGGRNFSERAMITTKDSIKVSKCWSCDYEGEEEGMMKVRTFFCARCETIRDPKNAIVDRASYYEILDVRPVRFNICLKELEMNMKKLQKALHPDKFSQKSEREREYSDALSSKVNEAYARLRDPLLRAKYLFRLRTKKLGSDEVVAVVDDEEEIEKEDENDEKEDVSSELLFLVMEIREAVEDAADGNSKEALVRLKEENDERMEKAVKTVGELLDAEVLDVAEAKRKIIELTYFEKIRKEIIEHT